MIKKPSVSGRTGAHANSPLTRIGKSLMAGLLTCSLATTATAQPAVKSYLVNNDLKNYSIEKTNGNPFQLLMAGTSFNNGTGGRNQIHLIVASQNGTQSLWRYYQENGTGYQDERCADIAYDPNDPDYCYITSLVRYYNGPNTGQDRIKVYKIHIATGVVVHENIIAASGDYSNAYPNHTIVQDGILYICGYNTPELLTSLPVTSPAYIPNLWGGAGFTARMRKKAMVLRYDPAGPGTVTHAAHFSYSYATATGTAYVPQNHPDPIVNQFDQGDFDMAIRMTMLSNGKLHVAGMFNSISTINRDDYTPYNIQDDGVLNLVLDPADLTTVADAPFGQQGGGFGVGIVETFDEAGDNQGYYILTNSLNQEILPDNSGSASGPEPNDAGGYNPLVSGASAVYIRSSDDPYDYEPFYYWSTTIHHPLIVSPYSPATFGWNYYSGRANRYPDANTRIFFGGDARTPKWFLNALQKRHDYLDVTNSDPFANAVFWAAGLTDDKDPMCTYGTYFPSQDNINPFVGKMNIFMDMSTPTSPQINRVSYDHFVTYPSQNATGLNNYYTNAFRYKGGGLSNIGWNCEFALQDHSNGVGTGDIFLTSPIFDPGTSRLNLKFIHADGADGSLVDRVSAKIACNYMDCETDYSTGPVWYPEGIQCTLVRAHQHYPTISMIYSTTTPTTNWTDETPTERECFIVGMPPFYKPSSIEDNTKDANMRTELYPNPAAGYVNLKLSGEVNGATQVRVEMSNIMGQNVQTLYSGTAAGLQPEHRLELPELAPGVYIVRIYAGAKLVHQQRLSIAK